MGTDKSRLVLAGQTFVERIAENLRRRLGVTVVGGSAELKTEPQLRTVRRFPTGARLVGCTRACKFVGGVALVVACDFPFITTELFFTC